MSAMNMEEVFIETGVMQKGHFRLTSGRHSDTYMQCARLFENPEAGEKVCAVVAEAFRGFPIDAVVGPALGGVIMAYEVARALGVRNFFAERESGEMKFRRGFAVEPGKNILIVEDAVTTGGSVMEVIDLVRAAGGNVIGVGAAVDRSGGQVNFGVPFYAALCANIPSWEADACPLCRDGVPIAKPGSRA